MKGQSKRFIIRSLRVALIAVALIFSASAARAVNYTVDNTTDDPTKTGCTAAADDCSLRGAIIKANGTMAGDMINFSGIPNGSTIFLVNGELTIAPVATGGRLVFNGNTNPSVTVSGNNLSRVFYIPAGAVVAINGRQYWRRN
jgi:hypothetical protein